MAAITILLGTKMSALKHFLSLIMLKIPLDSFGLVLVKNGLYCSLLCLICIHFESQY